MALSRRTPLRRLGPLTRRAGLKKRKDPLKDYCWRLMRTLVLARDHRRCRWCGRGEAAVLQAAHVRSRGAHPSLAWDPDNVITLCKRCHLYRWHRDPEAAADWARANLAPEIQRRLDFAARVRRSGFRDLKLVRIALEQQVKAAGLELPPPPAMKAPDLPAARRRTASG